VRSRACARPPKNYWCTAGSTSLGKVLQSLRRFSMELNKPPARWKENQIRGKIQRWAAHQSHGLEGPTARFAFTPFIACSASRSRGISIK